MSDAPHFWATFACSFDGVVLLELPEFLCCLPPLNTTMGKISCNFLCVPEYLHLPFPSSRNYLRKSFWVMRSKLFVLLTFEDSKVVWLPLSVLWDRGRLKEESWKAARPGGGRLVPSVYMIWETLISLGSGIPCQMPKERGHHTALFILILQNSLKLWSS